MRAGLSARSILAPVAKWILIRIHSRGRHLKVETQHRCVSRLILPEAPAVVKQCQIEARTFTSIGTIRHF